MPPAQFVAYTVAGTLTWTTVLLFAGHLLGQNYSAVEKYIGVISNVVLAVFVGALAWRYFQQWRHRNAQSTS